MSRTYDEENDHDIPAGINHVHFPSDIGDAYGHYEDEDDAITTSVRIHIESMRAKTYAKAFNIN